MQLHGLGKLTLLDYPGYLACTAFTGACNFRCPFCHNASLVLSPDACEHISEDEFFSFLDSRKGRLEGVCVTGGEATLQPDLPEFLKKIKSKGFLVKLDTNGYRPDVLASLIRDKLVDAVAMDIKNAKEAYPVTIGLPKESFDIQRIEESICILLGSGIGHEFRTTIVKELHDAAQMNSIRDWLSGLSLRCNQGTICNSPYFLQSFKPSDNLICGDDTFYHAHTEETLLSFVSLLQQKVPNTKLRGQ